jgi:urea transport system substrate-binding protein
MPRSWRSTRSTPVGGVLGKTLVPVSRGRRVRPLDLRAEGDQAGEEDGVVTVFGGWTSSSRKAMLPVFQRLKNLLWYPVQFEGNECSPNIMYSGAQPNQQALPALHLGRGEGLQELLPARLGLRLSPHRQPDPEEAYRAMTG